MTIGENKMEEEDEKPRTLLIGNIPRSTHKRDIEEIFGEIGPLKRCYIQYPREDKKRRPGDQSNTSLLCYVTFALAEDAVTAMETLGSHKISGNKIHIKFAKTRSEQVRPKAVHEPSNEDNEQEPNQNSAGNKRKRGDQDDGEEGSGRKYKNPNMIPIAGGEGNSERPQKPKGPRPKTINKKSRLIIRNLSFKVTEEKMKDYFGACGDIKDINILKKPDGKLVGCAFVQFDTVAQAAKAVRELNLKPFLGRPIAIDWALPKKDFQDKDEGSEVPEIKIEDDAQDEEVEEVKVKPDPDSGVEEEEGDDDVKFVNPYDSMSVDIKFEKGDNKVNSRKRKIKDESDDSDEDDDDDEDSDSGRDQKKPITTRIQNKSNDVEEGKTLFIRNLDFGVTEADLKQFFETYGPTNYALLCKDSLTEHPKGTGFVKFRNLADANKCLTDFNVESTKFTLSNRFFNIAVALPKEKLASSNEAGDKEKKDKIKQDNRNLYLVREGFIRPGSSAAEGVSISDMNKRAALNSTKKQLLKNLSIFVSPTRLCVHNLPLKLTDKSLRRFFKKFSSPESRITEARIMRDMKDIQLGGKGMSKGYGFVTYKEHEDALAALRTINNNPEIFSPSQRPIVEFSLENRKALQAKEKRMQKSVENNKMAPKRLPKSKNHKGSPLVINSNPPPSVDTPEPKTTGPNKPGRASPKHKGGVKPGGPHPVRKRDGMEQRQYSGLTGKVGVSKLPVMKAKGNTGGKITRKSLKGSRAQKKKFEERRNREPQIKPKKKIDKADDRSERLVSKHKKNLEKSAGGGGKKSKWYK